MKTRLTFVGGRHGGRADGRPRRAHARGRAARAQVRALRRAEGGAFEAPPTARVRRGRC
jgi:hypothetical protein